MKKKYLKQICILSLIVWLQGFCTFSILAEDKDIYLPNWSVRNNNGHLPLNSLAPYRTIDKQNQKKPLILIHGTVSDTRDYCDWEFLIQEIYKNELSQDEFDIYIYRYKTSTSDWNAILRNLQFGLKQLLADYKPNTKLNFIVSSWGGNLFCDAMSSDKALSRKVNKVISLGSPFWGTPLLTKELITGNQIQHRSLNKLFYNSSNLLYKSMSKRLEWQLSLKPEDLGKDNLAEKNCNQLRNKFINYGVYISSPMTNKLNPKEKEIENWLSDNLITTNYQKAWNIFMHYKMSYEIENSLKQKNVYLLKFNDGLVPIFSSLWLDPKITKFINQKTLNQEILNKIKIINPKARLFADLDHTDLTHTSTTNARKRNTDLLSGQKCSISDCIIMDLL